MGHYSDFTIPYTEQAPISENPSEEKRDLLLGVKLFGVKSDAPIRDLHRTNYFNTLEEFFTLTDGKVHTELQYKDPAFTHFSTGTGRSIYYRLNCLSAVSSFKVDFLRQKDVGIGMPYRLDIAISENGRDWQTVSKIRGITCTEDFAVHSVNEEFDKIYKAYWVKISFDLSLHVWIENISLYGQTAIPANAVSPIKDADEDSNEVNAFPTYESFCNVHNIPLMYNCFPKEEADNPVSWFNAEHIVPYLGYVKDGKIIDTMFDGLLFLPFARFTYSKWYKCAEGWNHYLDNTFAEGKNVDAANSAAKTVADSLGLTDYKVKIFLTILHTRASYGKLAEKFGDLDGDGIDEDMTNIEDRKKAIKWLIDKEISLFHAKERKYLELDGFYWFEEAINFHDADDTALIKYASDYLHTLGYKLFWIPFYQASGYTEWKRVGFDIACMQPNYAFHKEESNRVLYDNAELTKKYGMCYEIELNSVGNEYDINKYKEYLKAGVETGFMHTVKMYYQGGKEFYRSCCSTDPLTRSVYDDTYLFAKEKLTVK